MDGCSPGFWLIDGAFATCEEAFAVADGLIGSVLSADRSEPLSVIGDFIIPPSNGPVSRDFQTLHFDFGLPLNPTIAHDVARFTALYIAPGTNGVGAVTRLVPLVALLGQRDWPERTELLASFVAYGRTHGARDDQMGYWEGSLARVVDAVATSPPVLPSVKSDPNFLCGMEFDTLGAELAFFRRNGLDVVDVEIAIVLRPGQLLLFDNLELAHGRRGQRQPGELRQRIFGHERMSPADQVVVREKVLSAFSARSPAKCAPNCRVSIP